MPGLVDSFAKVLAGLEVGHVLARQRYRLAGFGIASHTRRAIVQRKRTETADLDSLPVRQRFAHELEDVLDGQLHVLRGQMLLTARD